MMPYAFVASLGWGLLYGETAFARTRSLTTAVLLGLVATVVYAISFLVPPRLYRYTNDDLAPIVQTHVLSRALASAALVLGLNIVYWFVLAGGVPLIEELFVYSLVAIILFYGFAGAIASHVVYLQQTKQYNSNQLVAVIVLVTLILLVLTLFFVALDWAIPRDEYIHLRDLTLITLVLFAYGRAVYLMAHH